MCFRYNPLFVVVFCFGGYRNHSTMDRDIISSDKRGEEVVPPVVNHHPLKRVACN